MVADILPPALLRLARFIAVGAAGTAVHWSLLMALVSAGMPPVPATALGFIAGGIVNYWLNRRLVFRSDRDHREALPRFFLIAGTGLLWNSLLMAFLTGPLDFPVLPSQVFTTGLLVFWHYFANAFWTFRTQDKDSR